jgi:hypothetical protein
MRVQTDHYWRNHAFCRMGPALPQSPGEPLFFELSKTVEFSFYLDVCGFEEAGASIRAWALETAQRCPEPAAQAAERTVRQTIEYFTPQARGLTCQDLAASMGNRKTVEEIERFFAERGQTVPAELRARPFDPNRYCR